MSWQRYVLPGLALGHFVWVSGWTCLECRGLSFISCRRIRPFFHPSSKDLHGLTYWCSVPFLCIQLLFLSGILTVFFCGIVMSHYTWHNVTESSRVTTKYDLHLLSLGLFLMNIWNLFALCYLSTRYVDRFNWWLFLWGFEDYLLAMLNEFMLDSIPLHKTESVVSGQ